MTRIVRESGTCCTCKNQNCKNRNHFKVGDFVRDDYKAIVAVDRSMGQIGRQIYDNTVGRITGFDQASLGASIEVTYPRPVPLYSLGTLITTVTLRRNGNEIERVPDAEALIFMLEK